MKKFILIIFSSVFLSACYQLTGEHTGANDTVFDGFIGNIKYIQLGEDRTLLDGTMGLTEGHSFHASFQLPEDEEVTIYFYSNRNLDSGVSIRFFRDGNEVKATVALNDVTDTRSIGNHPGDLDLVFDIHNDHGDTHILIWDKGGPRGSDQNCVTTKKCLYNTEWYTYPNTDDGPWGEQGRASGTFWGIQGDRELFKSLEGPNKKIAVGA